MHRLAVVFCCLSILTIPLAFGQTQPTDSQTLQALLAEVRQLRRELQANAIVAHKTQVLFFRLQAQQAAVLHASQRLDDARARLSETQTNRKNMESEAKRAQDALEHIENATEHKNQEDMVRYLKRRSEELSEEDTQRQTKQIEAEDQLRVEQAKLSDLQARLEELDKSLQTPGANPH